MTLPARAWPDGVVRAAGLVHRAETVVTDVPDDGPYGKGLIHWGRATTARKRMWAIAAHSTHA